MRKRNKIAAVLLCLTMIVANIMPLQASATEVNNLQTESSGSESDVSGDTAVDTSDMIQGADADIKVSGIKITGKDAGGKYTIQFTVSANDNSKYSIKDIQKVCPVIDEGFPFESTDEAYKIISGTSTTLTCSYSFTAKDTLETAYYPTSFMITYGRKSKAAGADIYADQTFFVNKSISVKITAKSGTTTEETTEAEAADSDITMTVKKAPVGTYGKKCAFSFTVQSSKCSITSVSPVINETFPFETNGDAYKTVSSKGTKKLSCAYEFKVREDVTTGYHPVSFVVTYLKNKKTCTVTKTINVKLTGQKGAEETTENAGPTSTPRLMVTGYDTSIPTVSPNSTFTLTLHMQNTSKKTISNIKLTLSTDEGEFLPVSGASTAYIESIAAGKTEDVSFEMKAAAGLSNKPYQITVKSDYEDAEANPFSAEDSVSIPVVLEDRISLTEIMPPDMLTIGGSGEVSFTINNLGGTNLNNVSVRCEGEDFTCDESFVGNVASGSTTYASVVLYGSQLTQGEGLCKIILSYENTEGETKTFEEETYVFVMEEMLEDVMMPEVDNIETGNKAGGKWLPVVIGIIVVAIIAVIIIMRKKKRLSMEEEELMDDDVL